MVSFESIHNKFLDNIMDHMMLAKFLRIMASIAAQCESTDYQEDTKK